jgi:hypothetical protein
MALGWMMGFDPALIPVLAERGQFLGSEWGAFAIGDLMIAVDGRACRLRDAGINFHFAPPPGWIGHIERADRPAPLPASA